MNRGLQEPILDEGIRNTHFVNGRLLTAEDMKAEQGANRRQHAQLEEAIGPGIARGLEVAVVDRGAVNRAPVLSVSAGLAFNRLGQAAALHKPATIVLVGQTEILQPAAEIFTECPTPRPPIDLPIGIHLLTARPASGFRDRAPVTGLADRGKGVGCDRRFAVEGIRFDRVMLDLGRVLDTLGIPRDPFYALSNRFDGASVSMLRNRVAHLFFGTEQRAGFLRDPLRPGNGGSRPWIGGAIELLRSWGDLTDCDVPLALFYWATTGGIQFLDPWSVRRRVALAPLPGLGMRFESERQSAEAEAIFEQFQDHVDGLFRSDLSQGALASIQGASYFRYLPPAGILPIVASGSLRGFDTLRFFEGATFRQPSFMEGARAAALFREALSYPPIDLQSKEMLRLYRVRENMQTIDESRANPPQGTLIFTNGHLPFYAEARFDLSRWSYSNFL